MRPVSEIRRINLELLVYELGTLERVALAGGSSSIYLSQVRRQAIDRKTGRPRELGNNMARRLEVGCGKPPGWMDTLHDDSSPAGGAQSSATLSQLLRHLPASNSPRIDWGANVEQDLPDVFSVTIEDDSMAPRVRRGDVVRFSRDVSPRPGDGVLVRDAGGRWYFRVYSERRPGEWEACALNSAYQPLDAARDGLLILAVLTGIEEQRWG